MNTECKVTRKWFWFVAVEFSAFFGGLLLIILWKILKRCFINKKIYSASSENVDSICESQLIAKSMKEDFRCLKGIKYYANKLVSTQFLTGKIVLLVATISAFLSTMLYLYEIFQIPLILEKCSPLRNPIFCVDLGCNLIFLIYFILRFSTSNEKVKFWLGFYSIVDVFTIPQILTSLVLNQEWIGLRFIRILSLMRVPEVLQCLNFIKSGTSIRIIQLITLFISSVIVGAGFFHLLENSGEITFMSAYNNTQEISYGQSLYFIVVTFSTVGYGDIAAKTICGRIFVSLFILMALATFASFIPELAEFLFARSQYLGSYIKEDGKKHVVVCGHINYGSVSTFLTDFLHEDREISDIEVVFINKKEPDIEMKNLLKIFFTQVRYFQGTVMDHNDLDRIQMSNADACIILANQSCCNPNDEDAGNIMRAISFKNYFHQCPVIIQLLQYENKTYLRNIPTWNSELGDQILCYSEIELGILAQSCLVPGFSTLLTNIFSVRSEKECRQSSTNERWLNDYMRGVTMEIYSAKLSRSFSDLSYLEIVEFCFKNLNLLLIAVEIPDPLNKKKPLLINPLTYQRIPHGSVGFFICDSYKDAINASLYCSKCHVVLRDLSALKPCYCKNVKNDFGLNVISRIKSEEVSLNKFDLENDFKDVEFMDESSIRKHSGFYKCPPQKLLKCIISNESQTENISNHIILCIFSDKDTPLIGMKNFIMPLRSSSLTEKELKDLIIIVDKDFIEKEWLEICNFPKIRVVYHQISLHRIAHLIAIDKCSRCVILNEKSAYSDLQNDAYMVDKEIIIANLYFRAESQRRICKRTLKLSSTCISRPEVTIVNTEKERNELDCDLLLKKTHDVHIPIISKLAVESNVQYLDVKEDNVADIPNYLRKPFAFGCAFTTSMLDSLLSTAYYNQNSIYIMEMLINGGQLRNDEHEHEEESSEKIINHFKINLLSVSQFQQTVNWKNSVFYRDIFLEALRMKSSVCLGLYRKRVLSDKISIVENIDRYVITNPAANFLIDETDLVYCLQQTSKNSKMNESPLYFDSDQR